jgi:hypothetical protein
MLTYTFTYFCYHFTLHFGYQVDIRYPSATLCYIMAILCKYSSVCFIYARKRAAYIMIPPPARRRDAGMLQVTERDLLALTWISEQYCICFDHLRALLAYHSPHLFKTLRSSLSQPPETPLSDGYNSAILRRPRKFYASIVPIYGSVAKA